MLNDIELAEAATKLSRLEVAEAVFKYCASRLKYFNLKNDDAPIPDEVLKQMRHSYDDLARILAPVSNDELHELIGIHEGVFNPSYKSNRNA